MESDLSIDYTVAIGLKKGRNSLSWCSAKHWILLFIFPGAGKNSKSAKVFSTLSWSWSFKSQQSNSESSILNSSDASGYGYHGKTLEKLYDEEQKLYKLVKVNYWTPSIICGWSIFQKIDFLNAIKNYNYPLCAIEKPISLTCHCFKFLTPCVSLPLYERYCAVK